MNSIIRSLSGNGSPKRSSIAEPSVAEQLESGAFPVRLSGPAGKDTGSGKFPRRFFFLMRGSISYCDRKGLWQTVPAIAKAVENRNHNRGTMFLGPFTRVARDNSVITLSYDEDWAVNMSTKMKWNERKSRALSFSGVALQGAWLKMEFDSEAEATVWEAAIKEEIASSYFSTAVAVGLSVEKQKKLNNYIWRAIFHDNRSLFNLYVSLTENVPNGVGRKNRIDPRSGLLIFDRLYYFASGVDSLKIEETLAFVLERATTFDVVERVMLLMCDFKADTLKKFSAVMDARDNTKVGGTSENSLDPTDGSSRRAPEPAAEPEQPPVSLFVDAEVKHFPLAVRFLSHLLCAAPQEIEVRKALLRVFNHPGECKLPETARAPLPLRPPQSASAESAAPGSAPETESPVVDWVQEAAWFKEKGGDERRVVLDWTAMQPVLKSPLCLLFLALERLTSGRLNGLPETSAAVNDIFAKILPLEVLEAEFVVAPTEGVAVKARHFIRFLLSTHRITRRERTRIFIGMVDAGRMNNSFFRAIVAEGIKTKSYESLLHIVSGVLFYSERCVDRDFRPECVLLVPQFPVIILEELWRFHSRQDLDLGPLVSLLMTFVLRAEGCTTRAVALEHAQVLTLSRWVEDSSEAEKAQRSNVINTLLIDLNFGRYLVEKCESLLGILFQNAEANIGGPAANRLSRQFGEDLINAVDYAKKPLEDLMLGLMYVSIVIKSHVFIRFVDLFPKFFTTYFCHGGRLRMDAIEHIKARYALNPDIVLAISNNLILNEGRHFSVDALDLMTLPSNSIATSVLSGLIVMALKFQDYENIKKRVQDVIYSLLMASETKLLTMQKILASIMVRSSDRMKTATIEGMVGCASSAVTALALLSKAELKVEQDRLKQLFDHYLNNEEVAAWPGLFKAAHSIAIFIKFMSREDIKKAYKLFAERNAANADYLELLKKVQSAHNIPVVSKDEMVQIMRTGTSPEAVNALLKTIIQRGVASSDADTQKIIEVSVAWMRLMFAKIMIPMAPKNTQIIAMLSCARWLALPRNGSAAFIAQVGTGEGKSLIIAMLAVYCVTVLRKKVHVLENNISLLDKDYSTFCSSVDKEGVATQSFFDALNVTASKSLTAGADVTYCLRSEMETHYRDGVFAGKQPFKNTVLIVDEVDELIVDADPNTSYVKAVTNSSGPVKEMFDLLIRSNGQVPWPEPHHSAHIWQKVRAAFQLARSKRRDVDYISYGGSEIYAVESGIVLKNRYSLWLEFLRYRDDSTYSPEVSTSFFYQNVTHLMTKYDAIVGLSGSLGCPSERQFLRDTYQASTFAVPPFLDTCADVSKHLPLLHRNLVEVHFSETNHTEAIIRLALEKFTTVPVLIVTKSPNEARALATLIEGRLAAAAYANARGTLPASDFVQLFLKLDDMGQHMPWLNIIEKATEVVSPGLATRRITVTDPFGGRGHDFMVNDETADENGGLMVIATLMPESERDWIQWKGRTARNDRKGQYAVILRASESPINNNEEILREHRESNTDYRPTIIDKLLELRDVRSREKIDSMKDQVVRGQRLNELCDHFYGTFNINATGEWPGCSQNEQLSRFLENGNAYNKEEIRQFAASMGVHYTSRYDN